MRWVLGEADRTSPPARRTRSGTRSRSALVVATLAAAEASTVRPPRCAAPPSTARSGADVLMLQAPGLVDGAACDAIGDLPGVEAAGAIRAVPEPIVAAALPNGSIAGYRSRKARLRAFGVDAADADVALSEEVATSLGLSPGDPLITTSGATAVRGTFAWPDDGRRFGFSYAALAPDPGGEPSTSAGHAPGGPANLQSLLDPHRGHRTRRERSDHGRAADTRRTGPRSSAGAVTTSGPPGSPPGSPWSPTSSSVRLGARTTTRAGGARHVGVGLGQQHLHRARRGRGVGLGGGSAGRGHRDRPGLPEQRRRRRRAATVRYGSGHAASSGHSSAPSSRPAPSHASPISSGTSRRGDGPARLTVPRMQSTRPAARAAPGVWAGYGRPAGRARRLVGPDPGLRLRAGPGPVLEVGLVLVASLVLVGEGGRSAGGSGPGDGSGPGRGSGPGPARRWGPSGRSGPGDGSGPGRGSGPGAGPGPGPAARRVPGLAR